MIKHAGATKTRDQNSAGAVTTAAAAPELVGRVDDNVKWLSGRFIEAPCEPARPPSRPAV